jgi:hypothetical protein
VESNIFKKMPHFPALLHFSELLGEDFGFNASSLYLRIDEAKVFGPFDHVVAALFFF